jgi:hypothetical protein
LGAGRACFRVIIEEGGGGTGHTDLSVPDWQVGGAGRALRAVVERNGGRAGAELGGGVPGLAGGTSVALKGSAVPAEGCAAGDAFVVRVQVGCGRGAAASHFDRIVDES